MNILSKSLFAIVVLGGLAVATILFLMLFVIGIAGILAGSLYLGIMLLLFLIKVILNDQ